MQDTSFYSFILLIVVMISCFVFVNTPLFYKLSARSIRRSMERGDRCKDAFYSELMKKEPRKR